MVDSHCEILWSNNAEEVLGCHPTEDYGASPYSNANQAIIAQHLLRSKMLGLWFNNTSTTDSKLRLRAFRTVYTFNDQYYGSEIFFVIVKMVHPVTYAGFSDIKTKLETMKMYRFKRDIPKANLHIAERINEVFICGETY